MSHAPETLPPPEDQPFITAFLLVNAGRLAEAIQEARRVAKTLPDHWSVWSNLGGTLIDAGGGRGNVREIREGIELLRKALRIASPEYTSHLSYNLANGYLALAEKERGVGPGTRPSIGTAIDYLYQSLYDNPTPQARINLASALVEQGRYVEAADELLQILQQEGNHPVALAKLALTYVYIWSYCQRHHGLLLDANRLLKKAEKNSRDVPFYNQTYRAHLKWLQENHDLEPAQLESVDKTPEQTWIWKNRLNLNLCPYCEIETPDAFDTAVVGGWLQGKQRRPSVEVVQDLVNALHRSFSTARWNLMQGTGVIKVPLKEQVVQIGGHQQSTHDLNVGLVISAISGFYSIFDQIAFALNSYLHLGHKNRDVSFVSVWNANIRKNRSLPPDRSSLHPRIRRLAHPTMNALFQLATSMGSNSGIHADLRSLRNSLEHHLVVVSKSKAKTGYFSTYDEQTLVDSALRVGQFARAAIIYFGSIVWKEEHNRVRRALGSGNVVLTGESPRVVRL